MRRATSNLLTMGAGQYSGAAGPRGRARAGAALPEEPPALPARVCGGQGSAVTATAQAGPAPTPDSARAPSAAAPHGRACGAGCRSRGEPWLALPRVPLRGRPAAAHLRAPGVLPVFPPEASAADLRHRPLRPRPPRPLRAGTARFRALRPASCGSSVASLPPAPRRALRVRVSRTRRERHRSRERARG